MFSGGFSNLKPTQNMFSFLEKPDFVWKGLLLTSGAKLNTSELWQKLHEGKITNDTKQEAGSLLLQCTFYSVNAHQPQESFDPESNICLCHLSFCSKLWNTVDPLPNALCSLGLHVVSLNEMNSEYVLCGEAWFDMKLPSFQKQRKAAHREIEQYSPNGKIRNDETEMLEASYFLLSQYTPAKMGFASKVTLTFLTPRPLF